MKKCILFAAVLTAAGVQSLSAAVLLKVPMQGTMLMPDVYYHADTDSLSVDLSNATNVVPQLTPLLVSNPNDSFSPADPWFDDLDPSKQGQAFSRRYGWEFLNTYGDLPWNRELWIRKLDSSPGLALYDYSDSTTPKKWNSILGTDTTTNEVYWSGVMWHFGVAAAPGTNTFAATFEVFLRDTDTGEEVANSSTGPFVLTWTEVPDGRPELNISPATDNQITVSWPASATNWFLLTATDLNPANWQTSTNSVTTQDAWSSVVCTNMAAQQFFRLQRNP